MRVNLNDRSSITGKMRGITYFLSMIGLCSCISGDPRFDATSIDEDTSEVQVDTDTLDAQPVRLDPFWTAIPVDGPGMRERAGLAFDPVTQRLILFGGCRVLPDGGCYVINDVWVLDASSGLSEAKWTQLFPDGASPPSITWGLDVSYDLESGRLLAAIQTWSALELWALEDANGVGAPRWTPIATTGTDEPSFRAGASVTHDPDRNLLYMFGGSQREDSTMAGDMWVLENASNVDGPAQWRKLPQAGLQPGVRSYHSAILDPASDELFIFGGSDGHGNVFVDGWSIELGQMVTARQLIEGLPLRMLHNVVGHAPLQRALLFLGCHGGTDFGPCRVGAMWHLRRGDQTEPLREILLADDEDAPFVWDPYSASVYDAEGDRLFFLGTVNDAGEPDNRLWVLSNASAQ